MNRKTTRSTFLMCRSRAAALATSGLPARTPPASPLGLQERTAARYLQDAGYVTGRFGKYVNGHASYATVPPYWDRWCEIKGDGSDSGGNATTPNQGNVDGTWIDLPD